MRISDWSSDVCSSDLAAPHIGGVETAHQIGGAFAGGEALVEVLGVEEVIDENEGVARIGARVEPDRRSRQIGRASCRGQRVSVRVDLGGRRIIKKKTSNHL